MATLVFYKNNEELLRYAIQKQQVTVGRSSYNDICLPDKNISRVHLTVEKQGENYTLADRSTNGTTVNSERVLSRQLEHNDRIGLGGWEIHFQQAETEHDGEVTAIIDGVPTQIISFEPEKGRLESRKAFLTVRSGQGKKIPLNRRVFSIGKNRSNNLPLIDEFISNFHCRIEAKRGDFYVKDLNSTNGTYVNGQKVVEVSLSDGAILRIGQLEMEFSYEKQKTKIEPDPSHHFQGMISKNKRMREIFSLIRKVAPSDATILLLGDTGTGKELMAQAVHNLGGHRQGRFVPINCGAIARDLIESELFGHEKGAFTSAHAQRKGAFEFADRGTLFLDEISEIPYDLQATLLRALESKEIKHVGGNELIDVDVRLIAATNANLTSMVRDKKFREDLFHRLYVVPINIPPLRERIEDIPLLAEHFLDGKTKQGKPVKIEEEGLNKLIDHPWEGNVRELKNVLERAVLTCSSNAISAADLTFAPQGLVEDTHFDYEDTKTAKYATGKSLQEIEREKIYRELEKNRWNKKKTADALGIAKSTLHEKIKKYAIEKP